MGRRICDAPLIIIAMLLIVLSLSLVFYSSFPCLFFFCSFLVFLFLSLSPSLFFLLFFSLACPSFLSFFHFSISC